MSFYPEPAEYGKKRIWNPVFVLALILGLYVLALGRMPNLRRECGAWTWLFALSMFVSAGVTVYYVCLTRAGSMNYVWTGGRPPLSGACPQDA